MLILKPSILNSFTNSHYFCNLHCTSPQIFIMTYRTGINNQVGFWPDMCGVHAHMHVDIRVGAFVWRPESSCPPQSLFAVYIEAESSLEPRAHQFGQSIEPACPAGISSLHLSQAGHLYACWGSELWSSHLHDSISPVTVK